MNKENHSKGLIIFLVILGLFIFGNLDTSTNTEKKTKVKKDDGIFNLLMSSENSDLEPFVTSYFKKKKIKLKIDYAGTLDIMEKINNGEEYDAIWASNSIWLYMLSNSSVVTNSKSTSINPIVFGIKKSLAEKLGFVGKDVYTKDILDKIKNKELNFIMSSATRTNTGASAYLGFLATLAGNPEVLTLNHLQNETLKNNIVDFLSGVERTSGSEEFLDELSQSDKYNAVVSYESSLINLNKELESKGKEPFYLIYPVDGVTISDSPLAYLNNGNNFSDEFIDFQKYILSDEGQKELEKLGRRVWYGGITTNVDQKTFNKEWGIDVSKYIVPIKYPSTSVIKEALALYQTEFRKPTHIVFCLDYSGSMYGDGNKELVNAMEYILDKEKASVNMLQFSYKDKVSIVLFATNILDVQTTYDGTDTNKLLSTIRKTDPMGSTNLYGSLKSALNIIRNEDENNYNLSIILMTDGMGNVDTFNSFKNSYNIVNKDIPVYGILFGDADSSQLLEISEYTGGKVFDGRTNLLAAFKEVRGYN